MKQFLQDSSNQYSSTRLLMFVIILIISVGEFRSILCDGKFMELPTNFMIFCLTVFGLKGLQNFTEQKKDDSVIQSLKNSYSITSQNSSSENSAH